MATQKYPASSAIHIPASQASQVRARDTASQVRAVTLTPTETWVMRVPAPASQESLASHPILLIKQPPFPVHVF